MSHTHDETHDETHDDTHDESPEVRLERPTGLGGDPFNEGRRSSWRVTLLSILISLAALSTVWVVAGERIADFFVGDGAGAEDAGVIWTCPMHPTVESHKPGTCPVCAMDLVPLMAEGSEMSPEDRHAIGQVAAAPTRRIVGDYGTVSLREAVTTTSRAAKEAPGTVTIVGQVVAPEDERASVTSWIAGRVDKLLVEETGTVVEKGQALARIYSEELSSAQAEYLATLGGGEFAKVYAEAAERKLRLYGMSSSQISRLRKRGTVSPHVTIHAAEGGTITERLVHQGQYVAEGAPLFAVTDLSKVWVELDVPEANLGLVEVGQTLTFRLDNAPAQGELTGRVDFISPIAKPETQTVTVRLVVDNEDGKLAPKMLARASLEEASAAAPGAVAARSQVLVPRTAILDTGKRAMVWVEVAPRTFEPRRVELGQHVGDAIAIVAGLDGSERVVEHAGYLIDPESPLRVPDAHHAVHETAMTGPEAQ